MRNRKRKRRKKKICGIRGREEKAAEQQVEE